MESGPFNRRGWATQSLRITAKELSLVSTRGKNTAIAERFSKYQRAAEESSAEKKKGALDGATSSLRSGNLSALKKRWEQAQKPDDSNSSSAPLERQPSFRSRPPVLTRLPSIGESTASVKNPGLKTAQGGPTAVVRAQTFSAAPEEPTPDEERAMNRIEATHRQKPEMLEDQVPTSPRAFYEKPRVPLTNLKMRFEKGEDATGKIGRTTLRSSSSDDTDHRSGPTVSDRVLESTSLREKMAKYQAAVSKHGPAQTGVAAETPAPKSPECNGETSEPLKTTKKFSPPVRETCFACSKTVYPLEKLVAQQHVYHKSCFKCDYCSMKLSLGNFSSLHGNIYCKPHYNQLFKTKGNYDEGFGHRPHKELWEPRVEGEEYGEEPVKTKEPEQPERATCPTEGGSDPQAAPAVETSSQLKVTDVTALLETRAQTPSSSTEKPAETRKLRIAWPPPAGEGQSGPGPLSPLAEDMPSIRPGRAKWPPDDEALSSFQSLERAELKSLRRSSSLKERSRPFTIAVKPAPAPTLGPRERRRPLKSLLDWRASFEERHPSDDSAKENKAEQQEENKKPARSGGDAAEEQEENHEQGNKEKDSAAVRNISTDVAPLSSSSSSSSPPPQPKENRSSQDVGFWEEEKEGSDAEEPSAEDMIKRNRYYDEEDSDS